ncbi:MAG: DUF4760 domain-containing protein [Hyphomonadaceae bacterium]
METWVIEAIAATVTAVSVIILIIQVRDTQAWNKKRASYDILTDFVLKQFKDTLEHLTDQFGWAVLTEERDYDAIASVLEADGRSNELKTLDRELRTFLRQFEAISISIERKIVVEAICKDYFFDIFPKVYGRLKPFIEKERTRRRQPKVFENFERVAKRWAREHKR